MAKFQSTDLFLLQRPSDPTDPYKAVTRNSMKYIGILTDFSEPTDPDEGALWWQPVVGQMFVYHNGGWIDTDGGILGGKVSKIGDFMTGDLVMINDSSVNFPLEGGLTTGNGVSKGHMLLLNFNGGSPVGSLTIPSPRGGLDTIAQWKDDGLYVLYPPVDEDHATNKKYVDDENEAQNLVINQNSTNIIALLDDLESVRPSIIRQKYDYVIPNNNGDSAPAGRIYFSDGTNTLNTYTDTVTEIYLNKKANNGITYDFQSVTTDDYVEVQDVLGIGILLCEITNVTENVNTIKLEVDVVKNRDDGTLVGDPDPTEVRVLIFGKEIVVNVDADGRYAKLYEPNVLTKNNTFTGPRVHVDSNAPLPSVPGAVTSNIFTISNGATGITPGDERFNINSVGEVTAGTVLNPFLASNDNDIVVKAYLDERMKRVGAYYGDTPPVNPDPGMLWYDTKENDLTMYMFYENPDLTTVWVPVYSPTKSNSGGSGYVRKSGDDMLGDLKFDGDKQVQTRFINTAQNSGLQLQFFNSTRFWIKNDHVSIQDANLKFGSNGAKIISNTDKDLFQMNDDGAFYLGDITVDNNVVNKGYTDTQDNIIAQRVVELEEEIRAIAPGLDKGVWEWDANGNYPRDPGAGNFYLARSNFSVTDSYGDADIIVINNNDRGQPSVNHTWSGILGKLIQMYDAADPDYILGEITAVDNTSNPSYTFITIDRLQSRGGPTEVDSNGKNTVRMSIFEAPELDASLIKDVDLANIFKFTLVDPNPSTDIDNTTPNNGEFSIASSKYYDYWKNGIGADFPNFYNMRPITDVACAFGSEYDLDGKYFSFNDILSNGNKFKVHYTFTNGKTGYATYEVTGRFGYKAWNIFTTDKLHNDIHHDIDYTKFIIVEIVKDVGRTGGDVGPLYDRIFNDYQPRAETVDHQVFEKDQSRLINFLSNDIKKHVTIGDIEGIIPKLNLFGNFKFNVSKNSNDSTLDTIVIEANTDLYENIPDDFDEYVDEIPMKIIDTFLHNMDLGPFTDLYNAKYVYLTEPNTNTTSIYRIPPQPDVDREDSTEEARVIDLLCIHDGGGYFKHLDEIKVEYFNGFEVEGTILKDFSQYPELT